MSDLQVALVLLGFLIIAGVVFYNWLQERKLRQEIYSDFIVPQQDVLAEDFAINAEALVINKEFAEYADKNKPFAQPTIPAETFAAVPQEPPIAPLMASEKTIQLPPLEESALTENDDTEAADEVVIQAALREKLQGLQMHLPDAVHPQVDLTAILYATKSIGSADIAQLRTKLADVNLLVMLHGLNSNDKWLDTAKSSASSTFKQLACSLQLADRGGPIAKTLLNKFQFAIEDAGLALNTHVEWQGSGDAMQRAIELDQFCIEVDQMVSVHIAQGESPIHGTKFKGLAEACGMVLKEDGKFHFYANDVLLYTAIDTNNVPFTLESLRSNVLKSITFQVEIPKVNNCEQVFNQMIVIAQKMATSLNGSLVDDNQKPLGDLQIEKIRQQLKVIHATMVARGIMPGSAASMRLFN